MISSSFSDLKFDIPKATTLEFKATDENVEHKVSLPDGETRPEIEYPFPEKLHFEFDFKLDAFQRRAISCVHNKESILVSAHTSAGKTTIAIYSIAEGLNRNSKVIYTSPIKALSNQKYRELSEIFGDDKVGLITGDITKNPNANVLIMTTEILKNMLYRGSSMIREVSWVIYDEIHYMRDPERGVVWEESIIMLPNSVRFVFLSATIPNAVEFSEWIATIHMQKCHIVSTRHRPTPLKFYVGVSGKKSLTLIKDGNNPLDEDALRGSFSHTPEQGSNINPDGSEYGFTPLSFEGVRPIDVEHISGVAKQLLNDDKGPIIVFSFRRKDCDDLSDYLTSDMFVTEEVSRHIATAFDSVVEQMDKNDRSLPSIVSLKEKLCRGIGVHHSGLMPLMRELTEILCQEGFIKILCATETFAMGINMPTKTVIFSALEKFDGERQRELNPSEFIQMSGRAGRRSFDMNGNIILISPNTKYISTIKRLLTSESQPMNSEFHVTYNMILSLLTTGHLHPEKIMKESFHMFQIERELKELNSRRDELRKAIHEILIVDEDRVKSYNALIQQRKQIEDARDDMVYCNKNLGAYLKKHPFVRVNDWGVGVITEKIGIADGGYEVLLEAKPDRATGKLIKDPHGSFYRFRIGMRDIAAIYREVYVVTDNQEAVDYLRLNYNNIVKITPIETCLGPEDQAKFRALSLELIELRKEIKGCEVDRNCLKQYEEKSALEKELAAVEEKINDIEEKVLQKDMEEMRDVIRRLELVDEKNSITNKGRVASMINAGNELIITQAFFSGLFVNATPQQLASVCSVFVSEGKSDDSDQDLPPELLDMKVGLDDCIRVVHSALSTCGRTKQLLSQYRSEFDWTYAKITYDWAAGVGLKELMEENSEIYEGNMIRVIKRTEDVLKEIQRAATAVGDHKLETIAAESIRLIKRDAILTSSLYVS